MPPRRFGRAASRTLAMWCAFAISSGVEAMPGATPVAAANAMRPATARAATIRFAQLSVENGLSQASVQAIVQDRDGYVWIGTQEGLNRYDGYRFVTYTHDARDPGSLANNWIWALHLDSAGDLWVGTDGGLDRVDPRTGRATHFRFTADDASSQPSDVVRDIAEDAAGFLWIGTNGGLVRLDPRTGHMAWLAELAAHASLASDHVRALRADARGYIWIGTDGAGTERLDPATGRVERLALADARGSDDRVRSLAVSGATLWIGTYEAGLIEADVESGAVRRYRHVPGDASSVSGNSVRALFVDGAGQLWVGTDGEGLNRFASENEGFRRYRREAGDPKSLGDDHVVTMFQDRGGVIWVGTYVGTSRWNPAVGAFETVSRRAGHDSGLSNDYVLSFAEAADGSVWIGTYGGGLNRWNRATDRFEHWHHDPADHSSLGDDRVFALVDDGRYLWIGTRGAGLDRLDIAANRVRHFNTDASRPESLGADGVTTLLRDRRGRLWVGTYQAGLDRLDDPNADRFVHFRNRPNDATSLCSDHVLGLLEDDAGTLWVGTHGGGICSLDEASGTFTALRHDSTDSDSLSSDKAWSIDEDAAGNFWIGTQDGGLDLWRAADRRAGTNRFRRLDVDPRSASVAVYGTAHDSSGRIWFSTNRGLGELDPHTARLRRFDVTDGLQSNEFNQGAVGRTRAGELLFGGISGFNVFLPESIALNAHQPDLVLTEVSRLGVPVDVEREQRSAGGLRFGYRDVLLTFEYAALDYTAPMANRYMHRLDGFDADWVADGAIRRATYTNLAPGAYTFEVKGANNDGVWSERPLRLSFEVLPAPWATWWARTGYALLAILLFALVYRAHARRVAVAAQIQRANEALRHEIDERLVQQRALVSAKEQAQQYLDVVEAIILSLDESGVILLVNQKGERVLGYAASDLVGKPFYETLVPAPARDDVRARFANVAEYGYFEAPIVTRAGEQRLIAWHGTAIPATADRPRGLLISGSDVTQVRNLERQMREAQKMEALGTLARGVAHDFNNILSAILGFAELSHAEVAPRSKVANYLERLGLSVQRARDLVKAILTFSRQARREVTATRVQTVVREALQLLRPTMPANIEIRTNLDESSPPVVADPAELHQLVMNLATNAYQAISPSGAQGGAIAIDVEPFDVAAEDARKHPGLAIGPHVRLSVVDTGKGMDETTMARMFEPFFTTKGPGQGSGLGLSVVHGIVTQIGGAIDVESKLGEGTRVTVLLPASARAVDVGAPSSSSTSQLPRGNETIMFVDDEPSIVSIAREMLAALGYRLVTAADAQQALRELDRVGGDIDLLVTDQTMPGMLGIDLVRAIKARLPAVPALLMSGAHDEQTNDPIVAGFLAKPFTLEELARTVRATLDARATERA